MFEDLRKRRKNVMKNVAAWVIFGAIILVFVFWGAASRLNSSSAAGAGAAARVNSTAISIVDVNEAVQKLENNPYVSQLMQGEEGRKRIQMLAVSQLVNTELAVQAADAAGLRTSDAQIRDLIVGIPAFNQDGRFQRERYNMYLQQIHKSPGDFETEIRREETVHNAERLLRMGVRPSAVEVAKTQELGKIKADLEFASFSDDKIVSANDVSEADIKEFLGKKENEAKVSEYFNLHKADFSTPEQVHARHILIKAEKGNKDSEAKALAQAKDIEERLRKKGDFAKLAKEFSDDPGSKDKGGDLGFFGQGKMVPEFEKTAFSLPAGTISGPVKTDFGYHLIEVLEKRPAKVAGLDQEKTGIAKILVAQEKARAQVAKLEGDMKKGDTAAVNAWVAAHKLKWDETGVFTLETERVPKIGANDEVAKMAFMLNSKKTMPDALIHQGPQQFILRYKAIPAVAEKAGKTPAEKPEMMAEYATNQRAQDAFQRWVTEARKTAKITVNPSIGEGATSPDDAPQF